MATLPTAFVDDVAVADRTVETPDAAWANGMNAGGSSACGVGINMLQGAVVGEPQQFTLLDQFENARAAQISQNLGGFASVPRTGNQPFTWDRTQALYTDAGAASSGGTEGTLPEAVIRYGDLPTQAAKDAADPSIDGTLIVVSNATLIDLAVGWQAVV
jgi:hypothetical protein